MDHAQRAIDHIDDLLRVLVADWHDLPGVGCRISRTHGVVELLPTPPASVSASASTPEWPAYHEGERLSAVEVWWHTETGQDMYVATGPDAGPGIYRLLPVDQF